MTRKALLPIFLVLAAITALIVMGLLLGQIRVLTRGVPSDLPGPMLYSGVGLGLNTDLEQYDEQELSKALMEIREIGIKAIKQSFYYDRNFDWERSDQIIKAAEESGLQLIPLLDGNPGNNFGPPEDLSAFGEWTAHFARRYGEYFDYYIIWDEPNLSDHWGGSHVNPIEYASLLTLAADAIRSKDPTAAIVAAPLAPTSEGGPDNLSETEFLQSLYDAGAADAFDIAAGKPYGFDSSPVDRTVDHEKLNFSRIILLREVMQANGDGDKAMWAGNWGWNSLPQDWSGSPSIWGEVDEETRSDWVGEAYERARVEWPWMGLMFLETWEPAVQNSDPHWGFSIRDTALAAEIAGMDLDPQVAYPGFQMAAPDNPYQEFTGDWRFSPEFGADVGESSRVTYRFWGTDIGVRVRRADFHGRLYATVDGLPPNELPRDENGSTLVLNAPGPGEDYMAIESIASRLAAGSHVLEITAHRGAGQWPLNGFSVGYRPPTDELALAAATLGILALILFGLAIWSARRLHWFESGRWIQTAFDKLGQRWQLALTAAAALLVAVAGWFAWGEQAASLYRRLGDGGQLVLTAAAASIYYFSPSLVLYILALVLLFAAVFLRPPWGVAIVAFSFPLFVKPKPLFDYQFSPVEIFLVVTAAAFVSRWILERLFKRRPERSSIAVFETTTPDYAVLFFTVVATVSLLFTERLNVASNEWRVVIIEPVILYALMRLMRIQNDEMWTILDAYILGGVFVAAVGLWQYASGQNLITSEGGLMRLRSIYGSPNNVALYLGRIIPILAAFVLMGKGRRRIYYLLALVVTGAATVLTFSKGSLFLGLPAALFVVFLYWLRNRGGRLWPWLVGAGAALAAIALSVTQIPQLADRLNPQGTTGLLRLNLWRASWNMFADHPLFGVGLDNFLYEYRGRYLFDAAWKEPNLNHPHNIFLDFATRLGLFGLLAGLSLFVSFAMVVIRLPAILRSNWRPVAIGLIAVMVYVIVHGLVDHSLFLVDLSFAFFFLLGLGVWLHGNHENTETPGD